MMWNFIWTRVVSQSIDWNNLAKMLGIADDAAGMMDEFGMTFRSFCIACDAQDLLPAEFHFQPVRRNDNNTF